MEDISKRISRLSASQLALLDRRLRQNKCMQPRISGPELRRLGPETPPVISFAQERLWLLHRIDSSPAYNLPLLIPFSGNVHVPSLERAIHIIMERHEPLRTGFTENAGLPVSVLIQDWRTPLTVIDFQHFSEEQGKREAIAFIAQETQTGFDLARGPLVRAALLTFNAENHLLLINMHHIAGDGLSLHIFTRELRHLWECALSGAAPRLPELSIRYSDFACWQKELISSDLGRRQLDFWRSQIAAIPDCELLPYDRHGSNTPTSKGAVLWGTLEETVRNQVIRIAHAQNATPFMVLLSAFIALLFRFSSQEDIVVATPVAGRSASELTNLIGCFINTLLLRVQVESSISFKDLIGRVREVCLNAFANQDFPFERLVAELPYRNSGRNPLFQVMFALQKEDEAIDNISAAPESTAAELASPNSVFETWAKFDLSFTIVEKAGRYHDRWEYRTDLFEHSTMAGTARCFSTLLRGALARPESMISAIPLLSGEEQQDYLPAHNQQPTARTESGALLHELVEQQTARTPDLVAVVDGGKELKYQELCSRASALALELLRRNLGGPEQRIGIFMERSVEMVVAILATLKTGAAYVPLDPTYPPKRIAFTVSDARLSALLVQNHLLNQAQEICEDKKVILMAYSADKPFLPNSGEFPEVLPENLAYVIYTSGSTGMPKGVMVPHSAIVNLLDWSQKTFPLTTEDAVLQRTSIGFDASVWEIFVPLIAGGRLVLSRSSTENFMNAIHEVRQNQVTVMQVVPSLLRVLLDHPEFRNCTSLKYFFSGGEALTNRLILRFQQQLSAELINFYGPTEAAVDATWWRCEGEGYVVAPIGSPIANIEAYVLDADLNLVPAGVVGELYLKGDGLARGYLNQPALTAQAFVPCPFTRTPGTRMYRTGDLARFSSDHTLHYLGRSDKQVKVRGVRLELAEIEAALAQSEDVSAAAVTARKSEDDIDIIAYIVWKPSTPLAIDKLREFLRPKVPSAAIPGIWVQVESLPLLANGKVDYAALPKAKGERPLTRQFQPPRTSLEQAVAAIWVEVLHLQRVGIDDNFFELGGHSLRASQVISRVRDRFGVEMSFATIFESSTIADFTAVLEALLAQQPSGPATPVIEGAEYRELVQQIGAITEEDAGALLTALKTNVRESV